MAGQKRVEIRNKKRWAPWDQGARYEDIFRGWLTRSAGAGLLDRYTSTMQAPPAVVPILPHHFLNGPVCRDLRFWET